MKTYCTNISLAICVESNLFGAQDFLVPPAKV